MDLFLLFVRCYENTVNFYEISVLYVFCWESYFHHKSDLTIVSHYKEIKTKRIPSKRFLTWKLEMLQIKVHTRIPEEGGSDCNAHCTTCTGVGWVNCFYRGCKVEGSWILMWELISQSIVAATFRFITYFEVVLNFR